eukprot:2021879-Alexandrium_andersonii.AAC.1
MSSRARATTSAGSESTRTPSGAGALEEPGVLVEVDEEGGSCGAPAGTGDGKRPKQLATWAVYCCSCPNCLWT